MFGRGRCSCFFLFLLGMLSAAPGRPAETEATSGLEAFPAAGDAQAVLGPRKVTVTLDRSRSVSATVPVAGKTLTARSANGTLFTLVLPAGALLSEVKITLTPVSSIGGLPFHPGLVAAVHLEPEGLRLFQAATLRIKPPAAVPRAQEMTFAYRGTGQEFFLFPPTLTAAGVEMKLLHFSGYGVAKGTLAEQAAQLLRLPTRPEDRMSQKLEAIVSKKRRGAAAQAGIDAKDIVADLVQVLRNTYDVSIEPNLATVKTNCATEKRLEPLLLGWNRQVQLVAGEQLEEESETVEDAVREGIANCYNEAFGKCVQHHEPTQVINMLSASRQLELLMAGDLVDQSRIEKCVRFDLDFETDTRYDTLAPAPFGVSEGYRMRLHAKVPLSFDGVHVSGSAPLAWRSATWTGTLPTGITVHQVAPGNGGTLTVVELGFDLNLYEGAPPPPNIRLTYDPGSPAVKVSFDFENDPDPVEFPDFQWWPPYYFLHFDEAKTGIDGPLRTIDWPLVGGAVWARKTYQRSKSVPGAFVASETTLMDLIHTPEP